MYFYGPVPSRRLGFSLGVDIVPKKVCSFDCVYCHVAKTTLKKDKQFSCVDISLFKKELRSILDKKPRIDYITISGSGEPTLNRDIGKIISTIKMVSKSKYPVCVITNSSLLYRKPVRQGLMQADLIVPSLDAVTPQAFKKINRPLAQAKIENIIKGIIRLRREFKGQIWLEVMIIKGINDSLAHAKKLSEVISRINPDMVQLNVPVRPAWSDIDLPDKKRVEQIAAIIGGNVEITGQFQKQSQAEFGGDVNSLVLEFLKRRPADFDDLKTIGINSSRLKECLRRLLEAGKIKEKLTHGCKYFISA